jgi:Ras-related protein Rab-7A
MSVPTIKVVILGDLGVGKTCLRSQFVHHVFTNAYKATIGGDYLTTSVTINEGQEGGQKVNLQIWDTAGQERFNSISQAFYRGTDVVILVYDITNYESVLSLRDWFSRFINHCHVDKPGVIIVGNKIDKINERVVDKEEIQEIITNNTEINVNDYILDWDLDLIEVNAKKLPLVETIFNRAAIIGIGLPSSNTNIQSFDAIYLNDRVPPEINSNCAC